jgi:ribulose-5-phosphate 4-epimerase/fuculose-1-phosphate aldolase
MAYAYKGVKFKVIFLDNIPPNDPGIRELIKWCGEFSRRKLAPRYKGGSYGNLSFRVKGDPRSFIITSSGSKLGKRMGRAFFVMVSKVDFGNRVIHARGAREPSSESMLHYVIYSKRKDVNAIFHGHCAKIMSMPPANGIPVTKKEEPYGTRGLVNRVMDVLGRKNFIIMKNHGFLSLGRTMKEAGGNALKIYRACSK